MGLSALGRTVFDEGPDRPASYRTMKRLLAFGFALITSCGPSVVEPSHSSTPSPSAVAKTSAPPAPSASPASTGSAALEAASTQETLSSSGTEPELHPVEPPKPPAEPVLEAEDGSMLPQLEEQPTADTAVYKHHVELLFEAIVRDDPEVARPFFFPVKAYEKVKAIQKPAQDWNRRLWRLFARDIHEYHAKLGDNPRDAVLERIEIREPSIRWMKPHTEGNAIGYYRVTRSRIRGKKANGDPLDLELTAMISWRGEWYVVHLHGFA